VKGAPVAVDTSQAEVWTALDTSGAIQDDPRLPSDSDALDLRAAYRDMVLARRVDTEAIALQRQGELGLWPSMLGQEAAQVGAAAALRAGDIVFPTYREHAVAWCRGVDPVNLLGLFRGTTLGGWDPHDYDFHLYTLVIGAQTLHAVGYAMGLIRRDAAKESGTTPAVLVFLGDGALSEGETNEAFVWAATMNLPVVFFCQNNQWAISAPFSVQSRVPAAARASGFGIPSVRVDGNDVVATHAATLNALRSARGGAGPTFIEAVTFRRNAHTTSDDAGRYRPRSEEEAWELRDPIDRVRAHIAAVPQDSDELFFSSLADEAEVLAVKLRAGCRALAEPDPADPFLHTLASMTDELRTQRDEHLAFVASIAEAP
jgi:TPP-dependent pyruvate/acetoin dehydrogenase alpha subunit